MSDRPKTMKERAAQLAPVFRDGHTIDITGDGGKWEAKVVRKISMTESTAPYYITAPSQTMLLETIRMILGAPRH